MPWIRRADALNPLHVHAAGLAVEDPGCEFPLQVGLHLQQLQPDLLHGDGDGVIVYPLGTDALLSTVL